MSLRERRRRFEESTERNVDPLGVCFLGRDDEEGGRGIVEGEVERGVFDDDEEKGTCVVWLVVVVDGGGVEEVGKSRVSS